MQDAPEIDGAFLFAEAAHSYLREIEGYRAICAWHEKTAAIHERGQELQLYRLFRREERAARVLRETTEKLSSWEESPYWQTDGEDWMVTEKSVNRRMEKHSEQHPIITRGIAWNGTPILIHAYKFEPDPIMKVELILPRFQSPVSELSLKLIATALECHEHLLPDYIAQPLAPYDHHEAKFCTIAEYLSRTMPPGLYATQCLTSSTPSIP